MILRAKDSEHPIKGASIPERVTIEDKSPKHQNLKEILLDSENKELLSLIDENDKRQLFRQIATIPLGDRIYCILKPLTDVGVGIGEALVFRLDSLDDNVHILSNEKNERRCIEVFLVYYDILAKSIKNSTLEGEQKAIRLETIERLCKDYKEKLQK